MILNEKSYLQALENDEQFSVLKGFKNVMRELTAHLVVNEARKNT